MEGGELKRQRRESSSIQVTQGDNAPLLVQDSVGAQIFFVLVLLCVSFFSRLFFLFFFRLFFFFKILPKKVFFFRFFFRVVVLLHTFDFATLREKKTTRNTHTVVTRRKEHVSGIAFFLSFFFL